MDKQRIRTPGMERKSPLFIVAVHFGASGAAKNHLAPDSTPNSSVCPTASQRRSKLSARQCGRHVSSNSPKAFLPESRQWCARERSQNSLRPWRSSSIFGVSRKVDRSRTTHEERVDGELQIFCGLFDKIKKLVSGGVTEAERDAATYQPAVTSVEIAGDDLQELTDDELKAKTTEFKNRLGAGETLDAILPEAFAVVREAAARVLNLRHFPVQLIGGMVLHEGMIAEMGTGEGKTLVGTLPAYLNALEGKGVHVVTVNDYLARRDAELMGQVHRFLGLSVGLIQMGMTPEERRKNYDCDITYVTNSELGFDYLRDNMALTPSELVQRPFNYCIVDEVDSILIDEARTPLILSGSFPVPADKYVKAAQVVEELEDELHYDVDEKQQLVNLTDLGFEVAERLLGEGKLFDPNDPWMPYIINALKAKELFQPDINYLVKNGEIIIIDEFTGRALPGRRWSDGLHQAVEVKEGVQVQNETKTLASISYQSLFKLYPKLSGMTGTAKTEAQEFGTTYGLEVVSIPPNRPVQRADFKDVVFKTNVGKYRALVDEVSRMYQMGRPVLIGTTSVETSLELSAILTDAGLEHEVLNAKPEVIEREAEIVAQAGRKGAITIATNMAGRGTDILLGGNPVYLAKLKLRQYLMPALASDTGKDLTPSEELFPVDLSEELEAQLAAATQAAAADWGSALKEFEVEDKISFAAEKARTEDAVMTQLRDVFSNLLAVYSEYTVREQAEVLEVGGLHVIGTERHESRRIDNQLRGRAGRQGDPGSTRFLLSLDDQLFRIFGGEKVKAMAGAFSVTEDMPIESDILTSSLEKAQENVEQYYNEIRKTLFDYDKVLNEQRTVVYQERRRMLTSSPDQRKDVIGEYVAFMVDQIVAAQIKSGAPKAEWPLDRLLAKVRQFVPNLEQTSVDELRSKSIPDIQDILFDKAMRAYDRKELEVDSAGKPGLMREVERFIVLQQIDKLWPDHMQQMKTVQAAVGLRAAANQDPLVEYQREGYEVFLQMLSSIKLNSVFSLFQYSPRTSPAPTTGNGTAANGKQTAQKRPPAAKSKPASAGASSKRTGKAGRRGK